MRKRPTSEECAAQRCHRPGIGRLNHDGKLLWWCHDHFAPEFNGLQDLTVSNLAARLDGAVMLTGWEVRQDTETKVA